MNENTPGQRLREARRQQKLTAGELGRRAAYVAGRTKPISASTVRNQENGTNGISHALADAYGKVLDVDPAWILFGRSPAVANMLDGADADRGEIEGIPAFSTISSGWTEIIPIPNAEDRRLLFIEVPGYWDVPLEAHQVVDDSLSPTYPRGTYLITAHPKDAGLRDGDHVILEAIDDDKSVKRSIRAVRRSKARGTTRVMLDGIGANPAVTLDWFDRPDDPNEPGVNRRLYPDGVVVAVFRQVVHEQRGRPFNLPEWLRMAIEEPLDEEAIDRLELEDEARAAEIRAGKKPWGPKSG